MKKDSGALARRYGTALFDILVESSKDKSDFEELKAQVRLISSFCTKKIIHFFRLPSLSVKERISTLEFFLNCIFEKKTLSNELVSFLKLVVVNKRFSEIKAIFYFFLVKSDDYLGVARATIVSVCEISKQEVKEFELNLEQILQKRIIFKSEQDETLKAGFVLKIGHTIIDASLKTRLNNLKELLH